MSPRTSRFGSRLHTQHALDPSLSQMANLILIEALCVDARRSGMRASDCIAHCLARTIHERERIAVWVAFRGRWQLTMDVFIMKEVETALCSPLRGNIAILEEVPYMTLRRIERADLKRSYRTLATRMDYRARLNTNGRSQKYSFGVSRVG